MNLSACVKGKAWVIPGIRNSIGIGSLLRKQDWQLVLERVWAMWVVLVAEIEQVKVALWETKLKQGVLVELGWELEKGKEKSSW